MFNDDFDPYDQLIGLTESHFEMAKILNDQASTIEQLVLHIKTQERKIKSLTHRITALEQTPTEYDEL